MKSTLQLSGPPAWVQLASTLIPCLPAGRYRLIRKLSLVRYKKFWMRMPKKTGGYSYLCDLNDVTSQDVCFTGKYEPQVTALLRALVTPGMTFVDVGANWGYYTLLAANAIGSNGRVIAFEPDPRLFRMLANNIEKNGLQQVTPLNIAAFSESRKLSLLGYQECSGNHGLSQISTSAPTAPAFQVEGKCVDTALDELGVGQVDVLKMDIEGAEEFALRGMRSGLAKHQYKRIILELHPKLLSIHGQNAQGVFDLLKHAGYQAWSIDHSTETTRRVAYLKYPVVRDLLRPMSSAEVLDVWPHVLWLSPDSELNV